MQSFIGTLTLVVTILILQQSDLVVGVGVNFSRFLKCNGQETGWMEFLMRANGGIMQNMDDCSKNPLCPKPECTSDYCQMQCSLTKCTELIVGEDFNVTRMEEISQNELKDFDRKALLTPELSLCGMKQKFVTDNNCKAFSECIQCFSAKFDEICNK